MSLQICTLLVHSLDTFSAYELYAESNDGLPSSNYVGNQPEHTATNANRFKRAFSHPDVKVHFVGAWCVISNMTTEKQNESL